MLAAEPALAELAKAICCPKRGNRCTGDCPAENTYFAAAAAVRDLYRRAAAADKG